MGWTVSSGFQLPANYVERSSIRTKEEAEAILNERTDNYGRGSLGQPQLAGNVMLQSPPKNLHPIVTSSFSPLFTSVPKDDFAAIQKDMISDQPYLYNPRKEVPHQFDAQKVKSEGVGQGNELLQAGFNPNHYTGDLATRQSPRQIYQGYNGQLQNIPSSWTGGYQSNMPSSSPSKRYETQNRTLIEVKTSYPKGLPENKQDRELKAAAQEDKSKENKIHHGFKMMKKPLNKIQTVEHRIEEDLENLEEALVHRLQFGETHPKPAVKMTREEKIALRRAEHKAAVRAEIEKEIEELLNASRKK